jgi:twitching motility protein PilT
MSNDFDWSKVLGEQEAEKQSAKPQPLPPSELNEVAKLTEQIIADQAARQKSAPVATGTEPESGHEAKQADESDMEFVVDPRTGLQADASAIKAIKAQEMSDAQARANYRPAAVDQSVHAIDISSHQFDQIEEQEMAVQADVTELESIHIDEILRDAIERKASDVHLTVGLPPMIRLDGEVAPLPYTPIKPEDVRRMVYETLNDEQVQRFESTHELDFAYVVTGLARFRFNVYMQRGSVCGALRAIPTKIPSFEALGLPATIREIAKRTSGLILVTGPTGSGKSTTIASMIDDINDTRTSHILTIEDPIEYLHYHKKCMVNQREMHSDTYSFHNALRAVLREDPDIILVGELRDLETIEAALTLAETGHLVFGTLHTRNAPATIDRIIDVFPSDQQDQIRVLLGNTLEGVISQQLIPRLGGGRAAAIEIMIGTPAIKNLIREGKTHQMYSSIETGTQYGMQTMDASLAAHFKNGYCSFEECLMRAVDKESLSRLCKGAA